MHLRINLRTGAGSRSPPLYPLCLARSRHRCQPSGLLALNSEYTCRLLLTLGAANTGAAISMIRAAANSLFMTLAPYQGVIVSTWTFIEPANLRSDCEYESSERGFCYLWCWGPAIPKSGQGPAFRVVSSYASALPEQLCACRLAPPCTRRERVTRPRGEDHEDLRAARQSLRVAGPGCLCRSTAQPLREPIAGARRRPKLSEFSRTLADTFTGVTPTRTRRSARVMHRGRASD